MREGFRSGYAASNLLFQAFLHMGRPFFLPFHFFRLPCLASAAASAYTLLFVSGHACARWRAARQMQTSHAQALASGFTGG